MKRNNAANQKPRSYYAINSFENISVSTFRWNALQSNRETLKLSVGRFLFKHSVSPPLSTNDLYTLAR